MLKANTVYKVSLGPARCALDLGDGSERGLYVNQDYILRKLGRPHRAINIMYCYYPLDKEWPNRASEAYEGDVSFAWDYPYDDYFPYEGGLNQPRGTQPFECMKDIRRHGQDVLLTLTIDPHVGDEHLIAIAKDLIPYGRILLRINHEATGDWFSFNRRCTYQEVADFYIRCHKIIKEYAPNVTTILCIGGIEDPTTPEMEKEEEFTEAVKTTDIWSVDKYMALHWGWPYDVAEVGGESQKRDTVETIYNLTKLSYERFLYLNGGKSKPMVISEFNADGDVTGAYEQASMLKEFCDILKKEQPSWFTGFTFYQFRDDGRLGLEITDPNNKDVGYEQPILTTYKNIIHDDYFYPSLSVTDEISLPAKLRFGGSEDAEGLAIILHFEKNPVFCELYFEDDLLDKNLMFEINHHWFYKAPGVKWIDLMEAFFHKKIENDTTISLHMFAPPASGENDPSQGEDWATNYYCEIKSLPKVRIRYEAVM